MAHQDGTSDEKTARTKGPRVIDKQRWLGVRSAAFQAASRQDAGGTDGDDGQDVSVTIRSRGRLPHWEMDDAIYFVTFRLGDSLPRYVLDEIRADIAYLEKKKLKGNDALSKSEEQELKRLTNDRIMEYLDNGAGACHLKDPRIAELLRDSLLHFDGERYRLHGWCVMPNHVHLVMELAVSGTLDKVVHSLKSYTANRANKILGRKGPFWDREYYDRIVRNPEEYTRTLEYVRDNPVKAGLKNWVYVDVDCNAVFQTTCPQDASGRDEGLR